jgi:hypothetical protein
MIRSSTTKEPEMNTLFCQRIKFDRRAGLHGDLYAHVAKPVVIRAVMVVKSEQASSVMVQQGMPYVAFMTGNEAFRGDAYPHSHFFATADEAVAFAKAEAAHHPAA